VRDRDGQQLCYVYFEEEAGPRSAAKLLTKDEARRIAATLAIFEDHLREIEAKRDMLAEKRDAVTTLGKAISRIAAKRSYVRILFSRIAVMALVHDGSGTVAGRCNLPFGRMSGTPMCCPPPRSWTSV
jgi:hypothetical protein